ANGSCCGAEGSCDAGSAFYQLEERQMPETVVSYGCGNPLAIDSLNAGETVIDLGSGPGLDCFLAAEKVGTDGHVIGIDMTAEMLKLARGNARKLGLSNVEFREGLIE